MKKLIAFSIVGLLIAACMAYAQSESAPAYFHLSFEDFSFLDDDYIARSGLKTIEDRGLTLEPGRFGSGLKMNIIPTRITQDNMSGIDLDMVTAAGYNTRHNRKGDTGFNEPFLWGGAKFSPGSGSVAFWFRGPVTEGMLFEQSAMAWGRKERYLFAVTVDGRGVPGAFMRDARYEDHAVHAREPLAPDSWNHIVVNWDKANGLELFVNGQSVASSWGNDAWWETPLPGLMHVPMPGVVYDEFYIFPRPLSGEAIRTLMQSNAPPREAAGIRERTPRERDRLSRALGLDGDLSLPLARPMDESEVLSFKEITPDFAGDGNVPGWFCRDGRYELAWPHPAGVFTIIPGDADFQAEKLDIDTPPGVPYNYIAIEGNLNGMPDVLTGAKRNGDHFIGTSFAQVPQDGRFFFGTTIDRAPHPRITLPFLKGYGAPDEFKGDVRLPLTGDTRIHEVGLFDVTEREDGVTPGERVYYFREGGSLEYRYDFAFRMLNQADDRATLFGYAAPPESGEKWLRTGYLRRTNLITAPMTGDRQVDAIVLDMTIKTEGADDALLVRLRDPGVPHRIWTHAEVALRGFDGDGGRLRLMLDPPPLFLVEGDVIWLDIATRGNASILVGGSQPAKVILKPASYFDSMNAYEEKALLPNMAEFTKAYHHQPWLFERIWPDIMKPYALGGQFDSVMPAMAVLRALPGSKRASYYVEWAKPKYYWGSFADPEKNFPIKDIAVPPGVPRWAHLQKLIQNFRYRIIDWLAAHQNEDGQFHGGWNDDTLILRGRPDTALDSCDHARDLILKVFEGLDRTNLFGGGYCRIYPIDNLHNGDFVRERFRTNIFKLGDPFIYRRSLETAWRWGKPDETPINYGEGRPFLFDKNILEWYWGMNTPEKPYASPAASTLDTNLSRLASYLDDSLFYRFTDARIHTDASTIYNEAYIVRMILGGNADQSISAAWPSGGGEDISRWVTYADNSRLECRMFSFDPLPREVTARLFRIDRGTYEVTVSADNDGKPGEVFSRRELDLKRFDTVTVEVPSKTPVLLTVNRIREGAAPGPLPDLAVADYDCVREGGSLQVRVSNLGAAPSRETIVRLYDEEGGLRGEAALPPIDAPTDFVEKSLWLTFNNVPTGIPVRVLVDPDNRVDEIFKENNETTVAETKGK